MKIVVLDGRPLGADGNSWEALYRLGEVALYDYSTPEEILVRSRDASILIINKSPITAEVIDQAPNLKFIAVTATGFDCVDLAAARKRNIPVSNVPIYATHSVGQFVFALVLELCHHVALHDQAVRAGEWSKTPDFSFWKTRQVELAGKVMGIVGLGRIGRRVGELAHAFGMDVLAFDEYQSSPPSYQPFAWVDLAELLSRSDVISLHCPLTPQTAGIINRQRLALVKPGALLINTSRGGLVVDQDLADALNEGRLGGAALDVVSREPILPTNPLLKARNCLLTPHMAWSTLEARRRLTAETVANVVNFLAGKPTNVVN